jgi:hypothetical protein
LAFLIAKFQLTKFDFRSIDLRALHRYFGPGQPIDINHALKAIVALPPLTHPAKPHSAPRDLVSLEEGDRVLMVNELTERQFLDHGVSDRNHAVLMEKEEQPRQSNEARNHQDTTVPEVLAVHLAGLVPTVILQLRLSEIVELLLQTGPQVALVH